MFISVAVLSAYNFSSCIQVFDILPVWSNVKSIAWEMNSVIILQSIGGETVKSQIHNPF